MEQPSAHPELPALRLHDIPTATPDPQVALPDDQLDEARSPSSSSESSHRSSSLKKRFFKFFTGRSGSARRIGGRRVILRSGSPPSPAVKTAKMKSWWKRPKRSWKSLVTRFTWGRKAAFEDRARSPSPRSPSLALDALADDRDEGHIAFDDTHNEIPPIIDLESDDGAENNASETHKEHQTVASPTLNQQTAVGSSHVSLNSLSDALLLSIFRAYLADPIHRVKIMSRSHPSIRITHVCRRWRTLSIGAPKFWSTFILRTPAIPDREGRHNDIYRKLLQRWILSVESIREILQVWLARSASAPLTFMFTIAIETIGTPDDALPCLKQLIRTLCGTSARWRKANFSFTFNAQKQRDEILSRVMALKISELPMLETLELNLAQMEGAIGGDRWALEGMHRKSKVDALISAAGALRAPTVRDIKIDFVDPPWKAFAYPESWNNLTTLVFHWITDKEDVGENTVVELLRRCPRLITGDFQIADKQANRRATLQSKKSPLFHRHVESLTIRKGVPSATLATTLELPALTSLHLPSDVFSFLGHCSHLRFWLSKFGPQLREVTFVESLLDNESLDHVLQSLSMVEVARFISIGGHSPQYQQTRSIQQSHLPTIRSLSSDSVLGGNMFSEETLLEFIISHDALQSVSVALPAPKTIDMQDELKERGVDWVLALSLNYRQGSGSTESIKDK